MIKWTVEECLYELPLRRAWQSQDMVFLNCIDMYIGNKRILKKTQAPHLFLFSQHPCLLKTFK